MQGCWGFGCLLSLHVKCRNVVAGELAVHCRVLLRRLEQRLVVEIRRRGKGLHQQPTTWMGQAGEGFRKVQRTRL